MAKKKSVTKPNSASNLMNYKHHLLPSALGGGAAFVLTGVAVLGAVVFASVWAGNALNHHLHKGK